MARGTKTFRFSSAHQRLRRLCTTCEEAPPDLPCAKGRQRVKVQRPRGDGLAFHKAGDVVGFCNEWRVLYNIRKMKKKTLSCV